MIGETNHAMLRSMHHPFNLYFGTVPKTLHGSTGSAANVLETVKPYEGITYEDPSEGSQRGAWGAGPPGKKTSAAFITIQRSLTRNTTDNLYDYFPI
jgi:hypothetical protein